MEHREAPRMAPAEAATARRFARFVSAPTVSRIALSRLGLAVLAGMLTVGLVTSGGWYALRLMMGWVDRQRPYQIAFHEITLDPPPPAWYRGSACVFLDRVRAAALVQEPSLSVLNCDLEELKTDFQKYAWVKRVARVRCVPPERDHPARLTIQLEYREPVAVAILPKRPEIVLDGEGVILPGEDIDRERVGPFIPIHRLAPPYAPRTGQVWKVESATPGVAEVNAHAVAAARLAACLKEVAAQGKNSGPLSPVPLIAFDRNGAGPFVEFAATRWLLWGEVPGDESPGQPTAEAKWTMLRDWVQKNGVEALKYPCYLEFAQSKLVVRLGGANPSDGK